MLFRALQAGESLGGVLGLPEPAAAADDQGTTDTADTTADTADTAELYGFAELQPATALARRGRVRPLLSVVPTTVWDESEAS